MHDLIPSRRRSRTSPRHCTVLLATYAVLLADAAFAQSDTADLTLDVVLTPAAALHPPGSEVRIDVTLRNDGPAAVPYAYAHFSHFEFGIPNEQVWIAADGGSACETLRSHVDGAGDVVPGVQTLSLVMPALAPGEAITCGAILTVRDRARGAYELTLAARTPGGFVDPDGSDNDFAYTLQITPPDAPLPVTDLSAGLRMLSPQPIHPPGTDARIDLVVVNRGPEASVGATFAFDQTLEHWTAAGLRIGPVPVGEGEVQTWCPRFTDSDAAPPGEHLLRLWLPGIPPGYERRCRLRLQVDPGAQRRIAISGRLFPQPYTGLPTEDPDDTNDTASLLITTAPLPATPAPLAIPATRWTILCLLGVLLMANAWRRCR